MRHALQAVLVLLILMLVLPAAAHVPVLQGDHTTLTTATQIQDRTISYAIYGTLHEAGEADYYTVDLQKGDLLRFSVSTPVGETFAPWLVIAGPDIVQQGTVPESVKLPAGEGAVVVRGVRPTTADFEPFTPIAGFRTANYSAPAPADGIYVIAVYTPGETGPYTLASGTLESFSPIEWVRIPVDVIGIRLWQGQSFLLIGGPYLVVLAVGLLLFFMRQRRERMIPAAGVGLIAGLIFLGSGVETILQTGIALRLAPVGPSIVVPLVLAGIALGVGSIAIRTSVKAGDSTPGRFRLLMLMVGTVGLVTWAGVIIGPVLALGAALLPKRTWL
ncbi:hypothetical protein [Methanosphaerula palustris]|uniref:Uncharacterized protein n=1 Tax=Methanosphaerula palustris (strain ATCC BAA-1556 / DSM 19958 / E1-9c) TaxID=521011 RepID=B8GJ54_METPE|nr:hypothetical protein [Methanosphaerula palustris]ACL15627.1 conserved hypothetical protein [Methanosphaerula palustris E1-9c]